MADRNTGAHVITLKTLQHLVISEQGLSINKVLNLMGSQCHRGKKKKCRSNAHIETYENLSCSIIKCYTTGHILCSNSHHRYHAPARQDVVTPTSGACIIPSPGLA